MKCPICEKEMESGFIQSKNQIFFVAQKHKFHLAPSNEDIRLTDYNFDVPNVEAWCCKSCKKVIISY